MKTSKLRVKMPKMFEYTFLLSAYSSYPRGVPYGAIEGIILFGITDQGINDERSDKNQKSLHNNIDEKS